MTYSTRRYEKTCERCHEPFTAARKDRRFCSDNCRKRAGDDRHRAHCIDCGAPLGPRSGWPDRTRLNLRCRRHEHARLRAESMLLKAQELWNSGMTATAIADELDTTPGSVRHSIHYGRLRGLYFERRLPKRGPAAA